MIRFLIITAVSILMVNGINNVMIYAATLLVGAFNSENAISLMITIFIDYKIYSEIFGHFYPVKVTTE